MHHDAYKFTGFHNKTNLFDRDWIILKSYRHQLGLRYNFSGE